MIGICKGKIEINIQVKYLAEMPLAGKDDPRQLNQREKGIANPCFWLAIVPLEREDGFKDDRVGNTHLEFPLLNTGQVSCRFRRLLWVILEQMAKKDIGIQK